MKKLAAGALFVLVAMSANANALRVSDADDSPGALDILWVSHGHGSTSRRLVHTIRMHEVWDSVLLSGDENWIGISIQSDPDPFVHSDDRFVWVKATSDGGIQATMHEMGNHQNGPVVGRPKVSRPDERTLRIVFRRRSLEGKPKAYRYYVESSYEDSSDANCSDNSMNTGVPYGACSDRAPETGPDGEETFIRHRIR